MAVTRYLGATWGTVHGPSDPRSLATWILNHGFGGIVPGPSPRPVAWAALRDAAAELPFTFPAFRLEAPDTVAGRRDAALASANAADRSAAMRAVVETARAAARCGVEVVVIEPGVVPTDGGDGSRSDVGDPAAGWTPDAAAAERARRNVGLDAALDVACRALFDLCKALPESVLCLSPSRLVHGLGAPDTLATIFEDLATCRLGYWHDTAIAARRDELLGEEQGDWLERFAGRMRGISVHDAADGVLGLPPGAGLVDFPLVASYTTRTSAAGDGGCAVAVELQTGIDPAELPGVHSFLSKIGL